MSEKPVIFVLGTGGTIAATTIRGRFKSGELTQEEIVSNTIGARRNVNIVSSNILRAHSADLRPQDWVTFANAIYYRLGEADGVVVTHGTDTMHYSSTAVAFIIQKLNKPIVFTGAQSPPHMPGSDARRNMVNAIMTASVPELAETVIVFNGKIFRACRSKKISAEDFDAFTCVGNNILGVIEQTVKLYQNHRKPSKEKPVLLNKLEPSVSLIRIHPGMDPKILSRETSAGTKGIVLEGYGLSNLPVEGSDILKEVETVSQSGIPVVVTSNCFIGKGWEDIILKEIRKKQYESSAIHVFDMLPETALVKLMWVLGQTRSMEKVKEMMQTSYIGEMTDLSKVRIPDEE